MAAIAGHLSRAAAAPPARALSDPAWVRFLLIGVTLGFLGLFLVVPLASVFVEALRKGLTADGQADLQAATALRPKIADQAGQYGIAP